VAHGYAPGVTAARDIEADLHAAFYSIAARNLRIFRDHGMQRYAFRIGIDAINAALPKCG